MRHFLAAAILLLVAQTESALAQSAQIPTTIPEMWNAWCARCHARDGTGKMSNRPVPIEPLDFTDCRLATAEPDADWELAISHGGPAVGLSSSMPAFGDALTADQIRGFVKHLRGFCKETGWPMGNLNLPRPIFAEKAFPEDEFVIAPAISHDPHQYTAFSLDAIYERRLGRRAQLELVVPFESISRGTRRSGLGNVEVGLKYALTPRVARFLLTAGTDVSFDTGRESQIAGQTGAMIEPYVAAATMAGSSYVQGQFKMEFPVAGTWQSRAAVYHLYAGRDTSNSPSTWTLGVELSGENRELTLTPQIRKGLTRTGALGAALGIAVPLNERNERSIQWVGYLLWEYLEPVLPRR